MKNLLYKEFKLASHPTTYIFMLFSLMFLIPNYPTYVQFLYLCLSIFFIFLNGRINQDIFYTVSLPIKKSDVVKARVAMIAIIQMIQVIISIPFAVISIRLYPAGNQAGIEPNVAFYGFVFILYSAFNIGFFPLFYRTGYKTGLPFLVGGIASLLAYASLEMLVWIPSDIQRFLDTTDPGMILKHLPILLGGVVIWICVFIFVFFRSARNFEHVDV